MYSFFFFKQKTAYEMRISDWSSDVCSSDLPSTAMDARCNPSERHDGQSTNSGKDVNHARTHWHNGAGCGRQQDAVARKSGGSLQSPARGDRAAGTGRSSRSRSFKRSTGTPTFPLRTRKTHNGETRIPQAGRK